MINIDTAAVLAIDLQNEYRNGAAYPVEGFDDVLSIASTVMAAARTAGRPVIHVQAWVEEDDRGAYPLLNDGLPENKGSAVAGSDGAELCAETGPAAGETVIRKRWPSAFKETSLLDHLRDSGITDLFIVGVWTDSCVRASVFDAVYRGFHVRIVKDACGSGTEAMHRTAVLDMANRLYGGSVLAGEQAVAAFSGRPYAGWHCSHPIELPYTVATIDSLYEAL